MKNEPSNPLRFDRRRKLGRTVPRGHCWRRHPQGPGAERSSHRPQFPGPGYSPAGRRRVAGPVEAVGDEPTFIQSVLPEHLDNVDFTFFARMKTSPAIPGRWPARRAATSSTSRMRWRASPECCCARRGWSANWESPPRWSSGSYGRHCPSGCRGAGLLLLRAQKVGKIARAVVTAFEPASEHGKPGHGRIA